MIMGFSQDADLPYWIARGMARRMGVNLTEALRDGVISRDDLAAMVGHCRECPRMRQCIGFLSETQGEVQPAGCRNAPLLRALYAVH
ncbi:DUF6455 family protein [Phaeovulum vinaykumarii]|uniref:DUF6455 domain-containing protein n=1 Tax=Phaeovulum vinaykumarii TaxID=407234 RepID=A0A1N7L3H2_9RHOB|nr:DUF6455 family protein [Phaeovulum vinaykumarii]SIS68354.1 hypothetical protein SAMN05421795_102506 [Phaeovulum vinaykumarii]SOC00134.1 hypothetical protein SAMN05878426_102266 [Phaeovulum vinaykumarii]